MLLEKGILKINFFFFLFFIYCYSYFFYSIGFISAEIDSFLTFTCDISLIVLGLSVINKKINVPFFIPFIILLICSFITFANNSSQTNIITYLNGIREFMMPFCAFTICNDLFNSPQRNVFIQKFIRYSYIFLVLQTPACIYQRLRYGVGDVVAGTIGSSGSVTIFLFLLCFFIVWRKRFLSGSEKIDYVSNLKILPLFTPIMFNETKISSFLLIFFFVFQLNLKIKYFFANAILLLLGYFIFNLYTDNSETVTTSSAIFSEEYLNTYLFKEYTKGDFDISRFTKIVLTLNILSENFLDLLFGKGIGTFKGGRFLDGSEFRITYGWLIGGTRPYLFFTLLQGGLSNSFFVLYGLFYPIIAFLFKMKNSIAATNLKNISFYLTSVSLLVLFYSDIFRVGGFLICFAFITMYIYNLKLIEHHE